MTKIAFIGAGNMNGSIITGLIKQGFPKDSIVVANPSSQKRQALSDSLGISNTASNIQAAQNADIIVLGVKPHFIATVCEEISAAIDFTDKCFVSVAAGCTIAQIQTALDTNSPVTRTMPNTPAQLGLGMTGLFASKETSEQQKTIVADIMSSAGEIIWLREENQIDHITSLSGSGPAYFFLFMEAMEQQAKAFGFSAQESRKIVQQTALGAANMVVSNPELEISQLRTNVTSKGGTTQAALTQLTDGGLPQLVTKAINAALHRAQEIADNG